MLFTSDSERSTVTLTRAELAALVGIASKDEARENLACVLLDPSLRAAVATDGHRLLVAEAGPAPFCDESPAYDEHGKAYDSRTLTAARHAARTEHAAAEARALTLGYGRKICIKRFDASAWIKAAGPKDSIRVEWGAAGTTPTAAIVSAGGNAGARFGFAPTGAQFPPWRAVMPAEPERLASVVAVSAAYLADACALLAKVHSGHQPAIQIWTSAAPPTHARDGELTTSPIVFTAQTSADSDGVAVGWRYVLMPLRADCHAVPWSRPAAIEEESAAA